MLHLGIVLAAVKVFYLFLLVKKLEQIRDACGSNDGELSKEKTFSLVDM